MAAHEAKGTPAAAKTTEDRVYGALALCELDGDEHTTAVLLEALGIRVALPESAPRAAPRIVVKERRTRRAG